jgi:hypothetical protein
VSSIKIVCMKIVRLRLKSIILLLAPPLPVDIILFSEIPVTTAARICVSLIVSFSYPLQCNPARRSVLTLLRSTFGGGREPSIAVYRIRYTSITVRAMKCHSIHLEHLLCWIDILLVVIARTAMMLSATYQIRDLITDFFHR